jgi:C5HC2 zinc finger
MDPGFDAAARECVFCHYDLYLSAVVCPSCPGKYACLIHAKELCLCNWSSKRFLFRYNNDELDLLLDALKAKFNAVLKWSLNYLGLSVQQYSRVQNEVTTVNASEEMRDATLTGTSSQHQHGQRSDRIPGSDEISGTRNTEAVPTRKDEEPSPSVMAHDYVDEVATRTNRPSSTIEEMRDAAVTGTRIHLQHEENPSGRSEKSRTRGSTAAATSNSVASHEGPSLAAMAQICDNMPAQAHNLPRLVKVGEEGIYTIEILEYGTIMPHEFWSTRTEIFPKGSWLL